MSAIRNFRRYPNNDYTRTLTSHYDGSALAPIATHYEEPGRKPARARRLAVLGLLGILFAFAAYSLWNSFVRYEAYGIVDANVVSVSSPTDGEVTSIHVRYGQWVEQDQVVAQVVNTADRRELGKIDDEINVVRAEIAAKKSLLLWETASNREEYYKAESELESAQGELAELRSRHSLSEKTLERFALLSGRGAVSQFEFDQARVEDEAIQDLIAARTRAVVALQKRLPRFRLSIDDEGDTQLMPLEERLHYLSNEKMRLEQRIAEGRITSPVAGSVSQFHRLAGERVGTEALLNIVEDGTTRFVLYYRPDQRLPRPNEVMKLWISSTGSYVDARVVGNSKDTVSAPSQIKRKYDEDARLVRVFLESSDDEDELVVGGVIMKPTSFRRIAGSVIPIVVAKD